MIRTVRIDINAAYPEMPLERAAVYTGSAVSFTVLNVPRRHGKRDITSVSVSLTNAAGTITTKAATREGSAWNVTLPASAVGVPGNVTNGVIVSASGTMEDGETAATWILGVGDIAVLNQDGTSSPDAPRQIVHVYSAVPSAPVFGDIAVVDSVLKIRWSDNTWKDMGGGGSITLDDTVTQSSSNGVKSSGIWSFVKGLLPNWLTSTFGEPYTKTATDDLLADKANATHTHAKSQITDFAHTHAQSDVTGLGDALAAKRDRTDMFTEWTTSVSISPYTLRWYSEEEMGAGWSPSDSAGWVGAKKGNASSTALSWSADEWEGGFAFTATRQRILTTGDIDATPTASSANPVQSGGVATALADKLTKNAPGGGYSIGWDSSNRLSLNGYLMATGIGATEVYDDGNRVLTSHQDISGKANVSDFALPSGGGAPSAGYVSSLFTSANTSLVAVCQQYGGTQIKQDEQGNYYYDVED